MNITENMFDGVLTGRQEVEIHTTNGSIYKIGPNLSKTVCLLMMERRNNDFSSIYRFSRVNKICPASVKNVGTAEFIRKEIVWENAGPKIGIYFPDLDTHNQWIVTSDVANLIFTDISVEEPLSTDNGKKTEDVYIRPENMRHTWAGMPERKLSKQEIREMTRDMEAAYKYSGFCSRWSTYSECREAGLVEVWQMHQAKEFYGSLWNYTGD